MLQGVQGPQSGEMRIQPFPSQPAGLPQQAAPQSQQQYAQRPAQGQGMQGQRPAGMPMQAQPGMQGQRPAGLPAQAAPQANVAQRLSALPPQAREQLRQNVVSRVMPMIQRAEQQMQQLRARNVSPQVMAQAMQQFDAAIQAEEAAVMAAYFGNQS
jgi:hypothetical protein